MASLSFLHTEYTTDDVVKEATSLAELLAKNARLLEPLPPNTDFSEAEDKEVQTQLASVLSLPAKLLNTFYCAFAVNHLPQLASQLRTLNRLTQPKALSALIQIFSLLPEPKEQPYVRRFLCSTECHGLPQIIADAFVQGIQWRRPSGPGTICTLLINMVHWCDPNQGDDKKACINTSTRAALVHKLELLAQEDAFTRLPLIQRVDIERLAGLLGAVEQLPGNQYAASTRQYLEGQLDMCGKSSCAEEAELQCAKCKTIRYCGRDCQTWHWKNGHKLMCFKTESELTMA